MPYDYEINTHAKALIEAIEYGHDGIVAVQVEQLITALGGDALIADNTVAPLYIAALLARRASE